MTPIGSCPFLPISIYRGRAHRRNDSRTFDKIIERIRRAQRFLYSLLLASERLSLVDYIIISIWVRLQNRVI